MYLEYHAFIKVKFTSSQAALLTTKSLSTKSLNAPDFQAENVVWSLQACILNSRMTVRNPSSIDTVDIAPPWPASTSKHLTCEGRDK